MPDGDDAAWPLSLAALHQYVAVRGAGRLSSAARAAGVDVGRWAEAQREAYWSGRLTPLQVQELDLVPGWSWEGISGSRWEKGLAALQSYAVHRDPARIADNARVGKVRLGAWVRAQQEAHRRGTLPPALVSSLESVPGWAWTGEDERWQQGLAVLKRYTDDHGSADVPDGTQVDGLRLDLWVQRVREDHRARSLPREREAALVAVPGWRWATAPDRWMKGCAALEEFVRRTGHSRPPQNADVNGFAVGMWVNNRRREYRSGKLADDQAAFLQNLPGWSWAPQSERARH